MSTETQIHVFCARVFISAKKIHVFWENAVASRTLLSSHGHFKWHEVHGRGRSGHYVRLVRGSMWVSMGGVT